MFYSLALRGVELAKKVSGCGHVYQECARAKVSLFDYTFTNDEPQLFQPLRMAWLKQLGKS